MNRDWSNDNGQRFLFAIYYLPLTIYSNVQCLFKQQVSGLWSAAKGGTTRIG